MRSLPLRAAGSVFALLLCVVPPTVLAAQRPVSVGVAGGVSVPQGSLRNGVNTGWHALGTLALSGPMQPLGLRLDAAYNRFAYSDQVRTTPAVSGALTVSSATLNATYRLPMTDSPLSPYLITGLGAYRTGCSSSSSCAATTDFGWNAGLGTKLYTMGVRSFLEARYHQTTRPGSNLHFFPVTFGVLF
jgi:hypothetical protein